MEDRHTDAPMGDDHWNTLQELLTAINALPGVRTQIEAYMMGRGLDDPGEDLRELQRIAF